MIFKVLLHTYIFCFYLQSGSTAFTVTQNDGNVFRDCMTKIGIPDDEMFAILDNHEKDADDKVKCYNGCLYKAFEVVSNVFCYLSKLLILYVDYSPFYLFISEICAFAL